MERRRTVFATLGIALFLVSAMGLRAFGGDGRPMTVVGTDRTDLVVLRGDAPLFTLTSNMRGRDWKMTKLEALATVEAGKRVLHEERVAFYKSWWDQRQKKNPLPGQFELTYKLSQTAATTFVMDYAFKPLDVAMSFGAPKGEPCAAFGPLLPPGPYFKGGRMTVTTADGKSEELKIVPAMWGREGVTRIDLRTKGGETYTLRFAPATFLHCDNGELRCFLSGAAGKVKPGETHEVKVTLTLPEAADFEPGNRLVDTSDWIVYEHKNDFSPGSVIGAEDWLDRPAGKHGWLKMDGDKFVFADGTPVKFYATNISWDDMACPEEQADQWNDKWAKHGVNLVRLHKFYNQQWAGIMKQDERGRPIPDPAKIGLFDYYHASAKKRGIYIGWSAVYHFRVFPGEKDKVLAYDELPQDKRGADTYLLKSFAPDLQDLLIENTVKLLERKNAVTGIRYADDPALAYIELHNEDDIFFFGDLSRLEKNQPTYFKAFQDRYNQYLKETYKTQAAVEKAWGDQYPKGQTLGAIKPQFRAWGLNDGAVGPPVADLFHFMYLEQNAFYQRFVKAIRNAGYQGAICGGCWQASSWLGHLYNTLSDTETGFIDRHNYAGTHLANPGIGDMSAGFQQVKNRPFNLSEWGGGPVGVPVVAVYGLGLQGWDAQCQFSSSHPIIHNKRARACQVCCDDFVQIGQFPILSRMTYRGDVKEGEIVANRRISIPGMRQGKVGFQEHQTLLGGANFKEFSASVPSAALAAGRVVLEYIDGPVPEEPVVKNSAPYLDEDRMIVKSTTGQLFWDYSPPGYFTINTAGTQGVVGWIKGKRLELDDVVLETGQWSELKLYVCALDKGETINSGKRLLVAAFGRDADTGMVFDEFHGHDAALKPGGEPLLLEPVEATITLKGRNVKAVLPLDHGGRMREGAESLKVETSGKGSTFTIDGKQSKTVYYLVELD
jgi:hypothetical protein